MVVLRPRSFGVGVKVMYAVIFLAGGVALPLSTGIALTAPPILALGVLLLSLTFAETHVSIAADPSGLRWKDALGRAHFVPAGEVTRIVSFAVIDDRAVSEYTTIAGRDGRSVLAVSGLTFPAAEMTRLAAALGGPIPERMTFLYLRQINRVVPGTFPAFNIRRMLLAGAVILMVILVPMLLLMHALHGAGLG